MMEELRMDDSRRQVQDWLAEKSHSVNGPLKEHIRTMYLENKELRGRVDLLSRVLAAAAAKGFGVATDESA
jgi:hypothetical protein